MTDEPGLVCDPNEDHEAHTGAVIPDPWDDPEQTDWPMNIDVSEEVAQDGN